MFRGPGGCCIFKDTWLCHSPRIVDFEPFHVLALCLHTLIPFILMFACILLFFAMLFGMQIVDFFGNV